MPEPLKAQPTILESDGKHKEDLTGRDRLVSNVIFSWAAQFVFIAAGFILPRMIDRRLGPELLGIWDLSWGLVSYFGLVEAGIGSSVNRYVAKYRAVGDISGVNGIVSSACCILGLAGMLVLGLTIGVSLLLPRLFGARLGENVLDAQWVVFFLGSCAVFRLPFNAFSAVLTGCHRWGLHNVIRSGCHAGTIVGMIVALLAGGSLPILAAVYSVVSILECAIRGILAHRVCEGLRLRPSLIRWGTIQKLYVFGGKSLIPSVSNTLLLATIHILIVAYLGPAALALYARPRALVRHMNMLVNKMAVTLTPTASSLQSTSDLDGIRELLIKSVRYSFYLALPMVLVLIVFGGPILQLWMGPRYANDIVPAILAVGYLAAMGHAPVLSILTGMNAHGRAAVAYFLASLCSVGLTVLVLGALGWGLAGIAVAVTLPLTIMNIVYLPHLICRRVGLDMGRYFLSVMAGPAIHVLPFLFCLLAGRLIFTGPLTGLLWGGGTGGAILMIVYYRFVFPDRVKATIIRIVCMKFRHN